MSLRGHSAVVVVQKPSVEAAAISTVASVLPFYTPLDNCSSIDNLSSLVGHRCSINTDFYVHYCLGTCAVGNTHCLTYQMEFNNGLAVSQKTAD